MEKKQLTNRNAFFRNALIHLAEYKISPELFYGNFKLSTFNDEFILASADVKVDYSFEIGIPHSVTADYIDSNYNWRQVHNAVLDWDLVERSNHAVVHTAINKNWDGKSTDSKRFQNDLQIRNRTDDENAVSEMYERAVEKAKCYDRFPIDYLKGDYEEQPISSFVCSEEAKKDIVDKCVLIACEDYQTAEHKKNLRLSSCDYDMQVYGVVVPRFRLTYKYNDTNYSVVDNIWSKDYVSDEQSVPTSSLLQEFLNDDENDEIESPLVRKMNEYLKSVQVRENKIEKEKTEKKEQYKEIGTKLLLLPIKILFWPVTLLMKLLYGNTKKNNNKKDNKICVKIKVSTEQGIIDKVVEYESTLEENKIDYCIRKEERDCQLRVIGLANALDRYNLAPMTEDDFNELIETN